MMKRRCKRLDLLGFLGVVLPLLAGLNPTSSQSLFGYSAAGLGDVNGDKVPDYAVGGYAHPMRRYRGAVWVYSGADHSILYTLSGKGEGDGFGERVSSIGDVNGDSVTDLLIVSGGSGYKPSHGEAFAEVHSGIDGSLLFGISGVHWFAGGNSGGKSTPVGDVNGDGHADFLALEWPRPDKEPGQIVMVSGADGSTIWRTVASNDKGLYRVPQSAASGSDVDRDGIPDVIVGEIGLAWGLDGVARTLSGRTGKTIRTLAGDMSTFGSAVSFLPDMDGDGKEEMVVSSTGTSAGSTGSTIRKAGRVNVYSGLDQKLFVVIDDPSPHSDWGSDFGASVSGCGDLDGDGCVDLLISDPRWSASVGAVYAYSGQSGRLLYRNTGDPSDWHFGVSLATLGDLDADGRTEFLVGCAAVKQPGNPGYASIFSGADGTERKRLTRPQ